jgi:hypothetical protein
VQTIGTAFAALRQAAEQVYGHDVPPAGPRKRDQAPAKPHMADAD